MKNLIATLFVLAVLGAALLLLYWAYSKVDVERQQARYSQVFEYEYNRGQQRRENIRRATPPPQPPYYGGTKESQIQKYRGNRYSTY